MNVGHVINVCEVMNEVRPENTSRLIIIRSHNISWSKQWHQTSIYHFVIDITQLV